MTAHQLPCPWGSPGKNPGVGCRFLLQCMKVKSESEVAQACLTLSDSMDCSPPGSSVHGVFQARLLEWGAIAFSAKHCRFWIISSSWDYESTHSNSGTRIAILGLLLLQGLSQTVLTGPGLGCCFPEILPNRGLTDGISYSPGLIFPHYSAWFKALFFSIDSRSFLFKKMS